MRVPFMLVFHQSICISAIKRILFYYRHVYALLFSYVLVCISLMRRMLSCVSE